MNDAGTTSAAADGTVDLTELVTALTDALDLVAVDSVDHGKRVAFMALEVARQAGLQPDDKDELFLAGILHDCGVSSTEVHRQLVQHFDWEDSPVHCKEGFRLLRGFAPLARVAEVVLLHHTRWDDLVADGPLSTEAWMANAVFLADRVDMLVHGLSGGPLLVARAKVQAKIASCSGAQFAPVLVDAFLEVSVAEAFWLSLESRHLERFIAEQARHARPRVLGPVGVRRFAEILARVVDAKSRFTGSHSRGVARLARLLAQFASLPSEDCDLVEVAGLLHDLGKLRVPDEVLDKPARLDAPEFATVWGHPFETYQILSRVGVLRRVADVAAFHHEAINGSGYPFHRHDEELSVQARIVAVADVFQALGQNRPYRFSLASDGIVAIMREKVGRGELDGPLVELLAANVERCSAAAFDPAWRDLPTVSAARLAGVRIDDQ